VDASTTILVRHGQTDWSREDRHTGWNDIPLNDVGRDQARALAPVLAAMAPDAVIASPLSRARETCDLAGFGDRAIVLEDCREWNYGAYEGLTWTEIREAAPTWWIWRDGCPEGEDAQAVGARADRVLARRAEMQGVVVIFAHGHFLQVLTARWLDLDPSCGGLFVLQNAGISLLRTNRGRPVIQTWNNTDHLIK
jgi:broad specificity phosphatase PhoE